jgi:hypothetical protein
MNEKENKKEREARQALEARLDANEELLAYTNGNIAGLTARPHHVGLTAKRLILLPLKRGKPSGQVYSIRRESIKSQKWSGLLWPRLRIKLPEDNLDLSFRGRNWRKRAKELTNLATQTAPPTLADAATTSQHHLQQTRDFQGLGFVASARHELSEALRTDPALSTDPSVASLREQLAEARLALRVGAGFLFANIGVAILITALLAILGGGQAVGEFLDSTLIASLIFDLWIGISLWRGRTQWRPWAILRAALGFIIFGLEALAEGNFLGLIIQAAFSGSLILVLTGESKRSRTWVAIGIYVVGYLGLLVLSMLIAFVGGLIGAL